MGFPSLCEFIKSNVFYKAAKPLWHQWSLCRQLVFWNGAIVLNTFSVLLNLSWAQPPNVTIMSIDGKLNKENVMLYVMLIDSTGALICVIDRRSPWQQNSGMTARETHIIPHST